MVKRMFVKTDAIENNNKFWEIAISDSDDVTVRYGRVGSDGQSKSFGKIGKAGFDKKIREKLGDKKGYREVPVVGAESAVPLSSGVVAKSAVSDISGDDPVVKELVEKLARINRHEIISATGGKMTVDVMTGVVKTALGVITTDSVEKAREKLPSLQKHALAQDWDSRGFISDLQDYLMLVPQKVDSGRGWHRTFLAAPDSVQKQSQLLDQLENSVKIAEDNSRRSASSSSAAPQKLFDASMSVLDDEHEFERIRRYCMETINAIHVTKAFRPHRMFRISIDSMSKSWEADGAKISNHRELFHGTRAHNLLSIMKRGLIIPRSGGSISVTARMFGDGLYFSDQSTKSLNYSYGYWDGASKDDVCYTFIADVAMGREYVPSGSTKKLPEGYDSMFAKAGKSSVMNNEMIVYRTGQVKLKYLVEWKR